MSPERRRLSQLPALVVADSRGDVRGWPVIAHDGRTLGTVADLLVDVDRLTADFLLVSMAGASAVTGIDAETIPESQGRAIARG